MRDGDAERVAEQGGDGEPVCQAAYQPGLGAGLQQAGPEARRQGVAGGDEECHDEQKAGGESLVPGQVAAKVGVGVMQHGGAVARGYPDAEGRLGRVSWAG